MKPSRFSFALALVACGGSPEPANVVVPIASATASAPQPVVHAPLGVPRDAIATATIDLPRALAMLPAARVELESELDLPSGALQSLEAFGYDGRRATTIVVAALSDDERKLVAEAKALAQAHTPSDQVVDLGKRVAATTSSEVRVLFPVTDAKKLEAALGEAMTKNHWHQKGRVFTARHMAAEFSDDGSWLALDVDVEQSRGSVDALRATFASARETPPTLEVGQTYRATYDPNALAEFGVLVSLSKVAGAVSGESIEPDQRRRIMAEGVFEAEQLVPLAGDAFDRIELAARAQPFEATLRAHVAQFTTPTAALWNDAPAARIDGASLTLDAERAFVSAMGSPQELMDRMRNGGWMSLGVALPRIMLAAPLIAPKAANVPSPDAILQDHFERSGISWTKGHETVFVGLLPANTTRAAAECALSTKTPCDAKKKLRLGSVVKMDDGQAKLVQVDKRFVVMTAADAASLGGAVKIAPAGPVRLELDTATLAPAGNGPVGLPAHVSASVANENGSIVIKVR